MRNSGTYRTEGNNVHLDIELLSAYIDGEVTPDEATHVEQHLPFCGRCTVELESLRWTVNLLREIPPVPVPHSFAVRSVDLEPERAQRRRFTLPNWLYGGLQWATVATAALIVLVFAADFFRPGLPTAARTQSAQTARVAPEAAEEARKRAVEEEAAAPVATVLTERDEVAELLGGPQEVPIPTDAPRQPGTSLRKQQPLVGQADTETAPQAGAQSEAPVRAAEDHEQEGIAAEPAPAAVQQAPPTTNTFTRLRPAEIGLVGLFVVLLGLTVWARRRRD